MLRMDVSLYIHTYLLFKSLVLCIDMRCSHNLDGFLKLWFLLGSATSFYIFTQQKLALMLSLGLYHLRSCSGLTYTETQKENKDDIYRNIEPQKG